MRPLGVHLSNTKSWRFIPLTEKNRPTFLCATVAARANVSMRANVTGATIARAELRSRCEEQETNGCLQRMRAL